MVTIEIGGLNLEKLLRECQSAGIRLRSIQRVQTRCIHVRIAAQDRGKLEALCMRFGWEIREIHAGAGLHMVRFCRMRCMLFAGAVLGLLLIAVSSQMVLGISVSGAQEYSAQVHQYLRQEGVYPGRLKKTFSLDALRDGLLLHLPGITHVSFRYAGSMLEAECHLVREGEQYKKTGSGRDLIASRDGIVTKVAVLSGTPLVREGEAVYAGQVLIRGEERDKQGGVNHAIAQGQVIARVWAPGTARAALYKEKVQETGRVRQKVSIQTPWYNRVVQRAEPFEIQHTTVKIEKIIDLFVPLLRRTEIYEEVIINREQRSREDAASAAQGAAEKQAKKQVPSGVLILDKWVEYSMIDNEFVCASVVLEYEQDIAVRSGKE